MFPRSVLAGAFAALILFAASPAPAAPITGTLNATAIDLVMDGADLAVSMLVTGESLISTATDDLSPIPAGTSFGPLTLDLADLVGGFSFGAAGFGSFMPASASVVTRTAGLLVVSFTGLFTPGAGLPGLEPTGARVEVAINSSGGEGGALEGTVSMRPMAAPPVPEPAMLTLMVLGGVAVARRRSRASRA